MSSRKVPLHLHRPGRRPHHLHLHSFYTNTLFTSFYTNHSYCRNQLLHQPAFTQTNFYTDSLLHTTPFLHLRQPAFTQTWFYPNHLLHRPTFTATNFYTNQLLSFFAPARFSQKTAWWPAECRGLLNNKHAHTHTC